MARLVGQDPEEYCLGVVPFDFQDHKAADKAKLQFLPGSVWKLEDVCLVTSNDLKFLGCTVNVIVDLKKSKTTKRLRRHSIYFLCLINAVKMRIYVRMGSCNENVYIFLNFDMLRFGMTKQCFM